jgi:LmbE family N-acetylglucosaminyl deacetylase
MNDPFRLMAVLAHPDDESLGVGGALAHYAAHRVETYLVTATRGERGRYFTNEHRPTDAEVGRVREADGDTPKDAGRVEDRPKRASRVRRDATVG